MAPPYASPGSSEMKPAPSSFLSDIKPNMAALPPPPTGTVIFGADVQDHPVVGDPL